MAKIFKVRNWNSSSKLKGTRIDNLNQKETKKNTNLTKIHRKKVLTKEKTKKVKRIYNKMNLDGSWTLKTSSSAEEILETLKNYVAGCFKTRKRSSRNFTKSESKEKFGIEVAKLRIYKVICSSSKNCAFEVNLKFYIKNTYIFQVINLEHVGHDF
eukprot:snap_masked-scaffold_6-processed-gene-9.0-mRNA-1 protein AED:1.00 eAED:1.00 QI:0/-1/0/0/-1/1/1/0/155